MTQIVDTSVFVMLERRGLPPVAASRLSDDEFMAVSVITIAELLVGARRADTPERRSRRERFVRSLADAFPVLPIDIEAAERHAFIVAELARRGTPIGLYDALIAATALANGCSVLTDNVREFARVPGLVVSAPQ